MKSLNGSSTLSKKNSQEDLRINKISGNSKFLRNNTVSSISLFVFIICLLINLAGFHSKANAQKKTETANDTVIFKKHSPHKATLYAMVLPGLGQVYNKKYWKIPIVYAGFAVFTYFIIFNRTEYIEYRDAYDYVTKGDTSFPIDNKYIYKYNKDQLISGRDYYRRNLELTYILTGVWYILTILDAAVDAHLFDYDISEDLSLRFKSIPREHYFQPSFTPGISLVYKF